METMIVPKGKDVLVFEREMGGKLFLVALSVKHQVGALADLSSRMEQGKFNVVSGFVNPTKDGAYGRGSWYMVATQGRPSVEEVKALLEASPYCKDVEVKEAHNGMLVDSLNFPLRWSTGDRAIMIRTHFFDVMERAIRALLSSGADVLLYQMGYNHGYPSWTNLLKGYRMKDRADLTEVIEIYNAVGWGRAEVLSFDLAAKKAVVKFADGFECADRSQESRTGCNFTRGHIAGLFANVFDDEDVKVAETSCMLKGDPACEFSVSV